MGMWFQSLRRTSQISLIVALIAAAGVVAYAASVLFNTAHSTTSLSKDRYVEVSLSGAEASGSVRPGSTVALSPVLTNQGDINCTALVKLTVPVVNGSSAYDYEINSFWTLVDADESAGVFVYGYGTSGRAYGYCTKEFYRPIDGILHDEEQYKWKRIQRYGKRGYRG